MGFIGERAFRREDEHGREHAVLAKALEHGVAVHFRQHQVEYDQVVYAFARKEVALCSIERLVRNVGGCETSLDRMRQVAVVFDDENLHVYTFFALILPFASLSEG